MVASTSMCVLQYLPGTRLVVYSSRTYVIPLVVHVHVHVLHARCSSPNKKPAAKNHTARRSAAVAIAAGEKKKILRRTRYTSKTGAQPVDRRLRKGSSQDGGRRVAGDLPLAAVRWAETRARAVAGAERDAESVATDARHGRRRNHRGS